MSWRDRLRPASFRGVEFRIDSADAELGRRITIQKLPGRRNVVGQDQGEDAKTYAIAGYVIGEDYDIARDALERALLEEGPGRLVHPTRGEKLVLVHPTIKVRENPAREGGFAQFTFTVTEKDPAPDRQVSVADSAKLRNETDAMIASLAVEFEESFDTKGLPSSAVASHLTALANARNALDGARVVLGSVATNVTTLVDAVVQLGASAEALLATPSTLVMTIQTGLVDAFLAAAQVVDTATDQASFIRQRRASVAAVLRAAEFVVRSSVAIEFNESTELRRRETMNLRAFDALVRVSAVGAMALAFADLQWSSYQEALDARRRLAALVELVAADAPDSTYGMLLDVRVAGAAFLDQIADALPQLRTIKVERETSALLLSQELFGDVTREAEIIARNALENPGLVPAGTSLEVPSV